MSFVQNSGKVDFSESMEAAADHFSLALNRMNTPHKSLASPFQSETEIVPLPSLLPPAAHRSFNGSRGAFKNS